MFVVSTVGRRSAIAMANKAVVVSSAPRFQVRKIGIIFHFANSISFSFGFHFFTIVKNGDVYSKLFSYVVDRGFSREGAEGCQEAPQEGGALQVIRAEHLQGRHRARADVPLPGGFGRGADGDSEHAGAGHLEVL